MGRKGKGKGKQPQPVGPQIKAQSHPMDLPSFNDDPIDKYDKPFIDSVKKQKKIEEKQAENQKILEEMKLKKQKKKGKPVKNKEILESKGENNETIEIEEIKKESDSNQPNEKAWLEDQTLKGRVRDVHVQDIILTSPIGGEPLLYKTNLTLVDGRHYGLVGLNGLGKTTLLKAIASYSLPNFPTYLRVMMIQQESDVIQLDTNVIDYVLNSDTEKKHLQQQEEDLTTQIEQTDENDIQFDELMIKLETVTSRLQELSSSAQSRAFNILNGLGLSRSMQLQKVGELSGGYRMRVALASSLFVSPDILLLDEPSNHLDFPAVIWLQNYLKTYKNTFIIVSHDRLFLNDVITDVIHLHNKKLTFYHGDYHSFSKVKAEQDKNQEKERKIQLLEIEKLKLFIEKNAKDTSQSGLVKDRSKKLEKIEKELVDDIIVDKQIKFLFPIPEKLRKADNLILMDGVTFGYNEEKTIINNLTVKVDLSSRIGILGQNGAGKSTILKLLLGRLEPMNGHIYRNSNMRIGYFAQHHIDLLDLNLTALDFMCQNFPGENSQRLRGHLGRFGIVDKMPLRPMKSLSGGQKSRVVFALCTYTAPHLVIMDEPTNHLDIDTIDALINAIQTFEGGVALVSHDLHFLSNVVDSFWTVYNGNIELFEDFDEAKDSCYKNVIKISS